LPAHLPEQQACLHGERVEVVALDPPRVDRRSRRRYRIRRPQFRQDAGSTGCGLIGQGGADCGSGFGAVKSIVIDPVRGFLYAGGTFSDLGGQLGLFAANLADGSFTAWQPDMDYPAFDLDLFKGDNFHSLFVAAGGAGGHVIRYLPHDGPATPIWDRRFDGDATAVDSSERAVYAGGHYDFIDGGAYRRKHSRAASGLVGNCSGRGPRAHSPVSDRS
jgi:hypothetical protein